MFRRRVVEPKVCSSGSPRSPPIRGPCCAGLPDLQLLDQLAVDGAGWVCVGTLFKGAITSISPDGVSVEQLLTGDPFTTNLCFGGPDMRTAYVTLSAAGRLVSIWWRAGAYARRTVGEL